MLNTVKYRLALHSCGYSLDRVLALFCRLEVCRVCVKVARHASLWVLILQPDSHKAVGSRATFPAANAS